MSSPGISKEEYLKIVNNLGAKKHKYNATASIVDGIKFSSKREAARYSELKLMQKAGVVKFFLRQTPFHLPDEKYICDFAIFFADGSVVFEDVKGFETSLFKNKKKKVEKYYPIKISILR